MLDLETLGTSPRAPIAAIGLVRFDPATGQADPNALYIRVDLRSYDHLGAQFRVDGATLAWWFRQSPEAIRRTFVGDSMVLGHALVEVSEFIHGGDRVWGNGSNFDNVILAHHYDVMCRDRPWSFKDDRCFRTMKSAFSNVQEPPFLGERHDALCDAQHQARWLCEIFRHVPTVARTRA